MPAILDRLVTQLKAKGFPPNDAYAIAIKKLQAAGNLKKGTKEATRKGIRRGNMSIADRAKDRAIRTKYAHTYTNKELVYDPKTNEVHIRK